MMSARKVMTRTSSSLQPGYCGNDRQRQRYGGVWGISESGYYAFDRNMYYQYRAFGLQRLSLMSCRERSRVISPYSTMLALAFDPRGACENIRRLTGEGGLGPYGMYEALAADLTQEVKTKWLDAFDPSIVHVPEA